MSAVITILFIVFCFLIGAFTPISGRTFLIIMAISVPIYVSVCMACDRHEEEERKKKEQQGKKARLAALPKKMPAALDNARRATAACLAMCDAAAIVERLEANYPQCSTVQGSGGGGGPRESELIANTKVASFQAIRRCWWLSVEGLQLTGNPRYLLLRGIYKATEVACENCQPVAGQEACPASELLEKVDFET